MGADFWRGWANQPARGMALGLVGAFMVLAAGCSQQDGEATVHRYTTRGVVQQVSPDEPAVMVRHEPIDNYVRDGKVVGMNSMTMHFPVASGVSLQNIKAGDKVKLTFEERRGEFVGLKATAIEKLPAQTKLTFGKAKPPKRGQ
jgi:Cu/Ag efflux protein CusF